MRIYHNIPALNAYNSLERTVNMATKSLEKLSSGLRINRAADDAAGLAISERMRGQIRGLNQAIRNAQDGISLMQTAEGAMNEVHVMLQRMRELAVQAANDTYTSADRREIQKEIDQLKQEINRVASTTEFNTKKLLDGSSAALVSSDKLDTQIIMRGGLRTVDQFGQKAAGGGNFRIEITATPGTTEIQKSDIFKIKHGGQRNIAIDSLSGINAVTATGQPAGAYSVETVDVSTATSATLVDQGITWTARTPGTTGNNITVELADPSANNSSLGITVTGNTITVTLATDGSGDITSTANDVIAAINSDASASSLVAVSGSGATALSDATDTLSGGTDYIRAQAEASQQYQQLTSNGSGLVNTVTVANDNAYNASMVFEVKSLDTLANTVTVTVSSHEYSYAMGTYNKVSEQEITLNTNNAANNIAIGNVTLSNIALANTNHFSVEDKWMVNVTADQVGGADKVIIRNDTTETRELVLADGLWDNQTTNIRSYWVDVDSGEVKDSSVEIKFGNVPGFAERPALDNVQLNTGVTGINAISADDLLPSTNYRITTSTDLGAANAGATVEKTFSQAGANLVTVGAVTSDVNASLLYEVVGIDGNNIRMRVYGHQLKLDGSYTAIDQVVTGTAGASTTFTAGTAIGGIDSLTLDLAGVANFRIGDRFTMFVKAKSDTGDDGLTMQLADRNARDGASNVVSRTVVLNHGNAAELVYAFCELDESTGMVHNSKLMLTRDAVAGDGVATFNTTPTHAATYYTSEVGDIARLSTRLYDIDKFWDANGNFMLQDPKTIEIQQGNGAKSSITLYSTDTIQNVQEKLNNAIKAAPPDGLGQGRLIDSDNFVNFVTRPAETGPETVHGTFVIRTAVPGKEGELHFFGDEGIISALSLTNIQEPTENRFSIDIADAHTGQAIATGTEMSGNTLVGKVQQNVDVKFDPNAGIVTTWDNTSRSFLLTGGGANTYTTYIHLADNTMVFQIRTNEQQDMISAIGRLDCVALGVDGIVVTDRVSAGRAITTVDNALQQVSSQRASLGAVQNRLEHTINNLVVAAENLTASESRIRDVDMAREMMEYTKANILNQAGTAMLAQANQRPQMVLQLLGGG